MEIAKLPEAEEDRIELIAKLEILDTPLEDSYDEITQIASLICGTPIALITIVDSYRQWLKSRKGLSVTETPREYAFCAHTILQDTILYVPDSEQDERFKDNPLVSGDPHVKFYAGTPLQIEGLNIGSLCVIDHQSRSLTEDQLKILSGLGKQVVKLLELRL